MSKFDDIISNPGNLPHRFSADSVEFEFLTLSREQVSEASFLRDDVLDGGLSRQSAGLKELAAAGGIKSPPANYIFHSAFCCSTLLARALDVKGANLSLKEPEVLMDLANIKRTRNALLQDRKRWRGIIEMTVGLLSRPFEDGETVLIKPTNAANNLLADLLGVANDAKALLLYSGLRSFLISILKKSEEGRGFARKLFFTFGLDSPFVTEWPMETVARMTDLHIAAVVWRLQMNNFLEALASFPESRLRTLKSDDLLADPKARLTAVAEFFGIPLEAEDISGIVEGPLFGRHSKLTGQAYDSAARREENDRIEKEHGAALDQIVAWERELVPGQPVPDPLPRAL